MAQLVRPSKSHSKPAHIPASGSSALANEESAPPSNSVLNRGEENRNSIPNFQSAPRLL
jgi:hypothetical protein